MSVGVLLRVIAFIFFVLAAIGVPASRVNLLAAGLAFWVLAILLGGGSGGLLH